MLAVILTILKIIGIVLLVIIGVLLALILLVLFWPFSYRVYGDNKAKINGGFKLSWLLHFISVKAYYNDTFNIEARILGIKIYDKLKKEAKETKKEAQVAEKEVKKAESEASKADKEFENEFENDAKEVSLEAKNINDIQVDDLDSDILNDFEWDDDETVIEPGHKGKNDKQDKKSGKSFDTIKKKFTGKKKISFTEWIVDIFEKAVDFILDIPWKIEAFVAKPEEKIDKLVDTICYYDRILSSNGTDWVIDYVKKKVFAILKALKPGKSVINIDYASTDPEKTAKAFEAFAITRPIHPKNTNMNVAFDRDEVQFDAKIKGNFLVAPIAYHGLTLVFNKKVKKFIKLMKREDS